MPEEFIVQLNERERSQRQIDRLRVKTIGGAVNLKAPIQKTQESLSMSYRKPRGLLSPTEKLTLRRLEEFLTDRSVDRRIQFTLLEIINGQMDLIEELRDRSI